ncbi:hypothetical protein D9M68_978520 [compost metagenome]
MADMVDDLDHGPVDRVVEHVLDETPVNLQVVHGQMLEIGERGHAGAKIIQRETATQPFQLIDEANGAAQVGNGAGFGNFETDHSRRNGVFDEQPLEVFKELVVANAGP